MSSRSVGFPLLFILNLGTLSGESLCRLFSQLCSIMSTVLKLKCGGNDQTQHFLGHEPCDNEKSLMQLETAAMYQIVMIGF